MPLKKQVLSRSRWIHGWNNDSHRRNVKPTEFIEAIDCTVGRDGVIRMLGGQGDHSVIQAHALTITPGYGLFAFSTDRLIDTLKITTDGTPAEDIDVGKYIGNSSDFTDDATSVGFVLVVTSVYVIVTKHLQGYDPWAVGQTIYQSTTVNDVSAGSTGVDTHGSTVPVDNGAAETGEDWLAAVDIASNKIDLYDRTYDIWSTRGDIDLGTGSGMKGVFYHVDGGLRVSDGNFGANNRVKWRGYIKRTHFNGIAPGGVADDYDAWYVKNNDLAKPTRGLAQRGLIDKCTAGSNATKLETTEAGSFPSETDSEFSSGVYIAVQDDDNISAFISTYVGTIELTTETLGGDTWSNKEYKIFPPAGTGFNLDIGGTGSDGSITAGTYDIAISFIYDKNQESLLYRINSDGLVIAANESITYEIMCTSPFDPRITGGRVYVRLQSSEEWWYMIADISLRDGVRQTFKDSYFSWGLETATQKTSSGTNVFCLTVGNIQLDELKDTYESINGFSSDEKYISIGALGEGYGTACVLNRSAWVGNVRRYNEFGELVTEGDAMYISLMGKFDTFILKDKVEVAIKDGEKIILMLPFADRIFQFKQRTLYIYNAAQEFEYLEATHHFMGIKTPAAACLTPFGIAWISKKGLYFHNGERLVNLLYDSQGRRRIKKSTWQTFVANEEYVSIGFYPDDNQLLLLKSTYDGSGSDYDGDVIVYDFNQGSFSKGDSKFTDSIEKTNFVNDWNGDLVLIDTDGTGNCKVWSPSSQTSTLFDVQFFDDILTNEVQRKKIYSIFVTHINSNSPKIKLEIKKIDSSGEDSTWTDLGPFLNYTRLYTQEFAVTDFDDVYSILLRATIETSQTAPSDFEIFSYSVVYMAKDIV